MQTINADLERPFDRRAIAAIVRRANPQLLKTHQRELRCIPSVGYRMVSASEQLVLADHRRSRANRQWSRGLLSLENARLEELTPAERTLLDTTLVGFRGVFHLMRGFAARQNKQGEAIAHLFETQKEHAAQLAALATTQAKP
jgi:hypothetical protein